MQGELSGFLLGLLVLHLSLHNCNSPRCVHWNLFVCILYNICTAEFKVNWHKNWKDLTSDTDVKQDSNQTGTVTHSHIYLWRAMMENSNTSDVSIDQKSRYLIWYHVSRNPLHSSWSGGAPSWLASFYLPHFSPRRAEKMGPRDVMVMMQCGSGDTRRRCGV